MLEKILPRDQKLLYALSIFFSIIMILISVIGDKGLLEYRILQKEEKILIQTINNLKIKRSHWIEKIKNMKEDPSYIEGIAREELGFVKKNEIVIQIDYKN